MSNRKKLLGLFSIESTHFLFWHSGSGDGVCHVPRDQSPLKSIVERFVAGAKKTRMEISSTAELVLHDGEYHFQSMPVPPTTVRLVRSVIDATSGMSSFMAFAEEELLQAEEALGVPLPEDFKTLYRL